MIKYKYQDVLSIEGFRILEDLLSGKITDKSFHSKRWYARKNKNIKVLIDLASAWELYKLEK